MSAEPNDRERHGGLFRAMARILLPFAIVAVAAAGVLLLLRLRPRKEDAPPARDTAVNVRVETVEAVPELPDTFEAPAVVEPNYVVKVSAEVAGRVEKIACTEGSRCNKGDLLMSLNADLLQASFDRAKAQAEYDRAQYERIRKLRSGGAATDQQLDQATASLAVSKAALESARAELDRTKILAPNSGILNDILVEEGEYLQAGAPVAEIVDVDTVKVVVQVPERDAPYIKKGDHVRVTADVDGDAREVGSRITFISAVADPSTRATRVEVAVDNRKRLLRSGQIVRARLTRRVLKNVIMVPLMAAIPLEDGKAVYVVEGNRAERRNVKLGLIRGTKVRILDGLQTGDKLIVAGHRYVGPGQEVRVVNSE